MSQATLLERPYDNAGLFSSHYLDERVLDREEWECDDRAQEVLEELRSLYDLEGELVGSYGEDALIDNWIDEVLDILGYGTQAEVTLPEGDGYVDSLLFETPSTRREAVKVYLDSDDTTDLFNRGVGLVEAKQWDADFSERFSEQRPYYNASQQIKRYLGKTPKSIQWGILTNGRKWRLYGTNEYEEQIYYEVDLPELLEQGDLEAFKYFYVFFRPEALRESGGTTFLDEVWSESETASQELGEDLQDNVFTALRVLGRGFVESNDSLDIDPDDDEALDELKDQSLVLLYRLMFVLYAESRNLIHPDNPEAVDEYEENFSLDELRLDIHEEIGEVDEGFDDEFSGYSTTMWSRLEDLFRLIDQGEEDLGIPAYNGGLFDHEAHTFLTENDVSNRYLAEVIYRLSTTQNDEGRYVLADYGDLDTRHLGSVYEGLLEHQFRIAPEQYAAVSEDGGQVWEPATEVSVADAVETVPEGGLYVVNDQGERKATGAYYTPDYVVTYIVEETVGPLVEEIREDLVEQGFETGTQEYLGAFLRRITDLKILDPAMGSGHFLTKATGYLSQQVMEEVREVEAEMGVAFDEQHIRREIAKECIYGVDLNGMAVELAKLSMWLETLAADRPLAFLDHHLKQGNSLVGSDIEDIDELESDTSDSEEQYSLAEFGATREGTIERLMDIYSEFLAIENETAEDVHEMKRKYAEIEQDELRQRLVAMANVHTAERFGLEVPGGAYEQMAKALENDEGWASVRDTDWFKSAQRISGEENLFHWRLSFPEVFYEESGSLRDDAGFDAVIGNPPYVLLDKSSSVGRYYESEFQTAKGYKPDLYMPFIEQSVDLTTRGDRVGLIVPNRFFLTKSGSNLRDFLSKGNMRNIIDFGQSRVFGDALNYVCILLLSESDRDNDEFTYTTSDLKMENTHSYNLPSESIEGDTWSFPDKQLIKINQKIDPNTVPMGEIFEDMFAGAQTGADEILLKEKPFEGEKDIFVPFLRSKDVKRYRINSDAEYVIFPYDEDGEILTEHQLSEQYPKTYRYLNEHKNKLKNRVWHNEGPTERSGAWYGLMYLPDPEKFIADKIICPYLASKTVFTYDTNESIFGTGAGYGIEIPGSEKRQKSFVCLLNSTMVNILFTQVSPEFQSGFKFNKTYVEQIPIPKIIQQDFDLPLEQITSSDNKARERPEKTVGNLLSSMYDTLRESYLTYESLNLHLLDYIGNYNQGPTISELSTTPPEGVSDSLLVETQRTTDKFEVIRATDAEIRRENGTVTILVMPYVKPKEEIKEEYELNNRGYATLDLIPAIKIHNLNKIEQDLMEAFIPYAISNEIGGYTDKATKTISLINRVKDITIPNPDDVANDIKQYRDIVERAEELNESIQHTNDVIDEIVYDLYGLTDEEIEIVEQSVADD